MRCESAISRKFVVDSLVGASHLLGCDYCDVTAGHLWSAVVSHPPGGGRSANHLHHWLDEYERCRNSSQSSPLVPDDMLNGGGGASGSTSVT